ncbi:MAG: hypothetical protein KAJ03_05420 [Gammaproteobacteria bacterium]|nr:hypothetical protein [Gammaproteobacteria bacterium]
MMLLKDSRGDKTVTLTILVISWLVLTVKLLFGSEGGWTGGMTGSEYAYAVTPFLASFGFREHDKRK